MSNNIRMARDADAVRSLKATVRLLAKDDKEKEPKKPDEEEEEPEDEEMQLRDVEILAFTGQPVNVGFGQEVFDLAGLETPRQDIPLLLFHDDTQIAGFSTSITNDGENLTVKGKVFADQPEGQMFLSKADAGFPWQASVRLQVLEDSFVEAGESKTINGREIAGPFFHDSKSRLKETSFVSLGADADTRAVALADVPNQEDRMDAQQIREQERERVKTIRAAFKADPEFALEHIEAGSTLAEAKAAYADVVISKHVELEERYAQVVAELEETRKAKTEIVPFSRPKIDTDEGLSAADRWAKLLGELETKGYSRADAVRQAAIQHSDLHDDYLSEVNA